MAADSLMGELMEGGEGGAGGEVKSQMILITSKETLP